MADPRVEKLAQVIVRYSVAVRANDRVVIDGDSLAEPLLKAIYTEVLKAGGHPLIRVTLPGMEDLLFKHASDDQLQHVAEPLKLTISTYDVRIAVGGADNTRSLTNVDPSRMVLYQQARTELMKISMKRSAAGELRWTYVVFPTNAYAQDAEMSLEEYEDFVYRACLPDLSDPVGYWRRFSERQQKVVEWLKGRQRLRVVGPDTDLRISISGRTFMNCDGHYNMPDGEVYTGPVEDGVEGHAFFSYPAIYGGREVTGVRLWFEKGRVVKATAEKNQDFLLKTLDTDQGSRFVGEFAIGTNEGIDRATREILFDEKINGSFHMALGAGYPETGSRNESAIHWDMVSDLRQGGQIWVDDQLLYRDGRFTIDF